ncbi:MAG: DUF616 domain-containing protein [Clostridia bacterium]|nr:DUF616 domain-containing protein [Clostridia bacterium]
MSSTPCSSCSRFWKTLPSRSRPCLNHRIQSSNGSMSMYPTDPVRSGQHIRLMDELKTLYVQGVIHADLKRALLFRFKRWARQLLGRESCELEQPADYFSDKRIAVYTVIYGAVDEIHEPLTTPDNCDFFIFTDQPLVPASIWQPKVFVASAHGLPDDPVLKSRYVKMFPDQFFAEYDYTLYLDGKFQLRTDPTELIHDMDPVGLKMFRHPLRDCVLQEIKACIRQQKGKPETLKAYGRYVQAMGMPRHYGLLEGAIILRQTGNQRCQHLMHQWWEQFEQKVRRDQLSLPFVLWQNNINIEQIGLLGDQIWSNPVFRKYPHRKNKID